MEVKKLIEVPVQNTGYIHEEPKPENYHATDLFGAVSEGFVGTDSPLNTPPVIFPTGYGWLQVARDYGISEKQYNNHFDTFSCVIFSIAKCLCYYMFKVYGIKITISEMYNAYYAGVIANRGTTIDKGMESFRKHGWIEDWEYPLEADTTLVEYMQTPPKTIQLKAEGKLTEWEFHWEVVPKNLRAIFEAYKYTPVVLTGFAWASYYGEGVFYDNGNQANHAFVGLEPKEMPVPDTLCNNICDDTYPRDRNDEDLQKDDMLKELHSSFHYGSAHRCWLTPKKKELSLLIKLKNMIKDIWMWFETEGSPKGVRAYFVPKDNKGKIKGKQEINLEDPIVAVKALYSALYNAGAVKKTDWGEISNIEDKKFI